MKNKGQHPLNPRDVGLSLRCGAIQGKTGLAVTGWPVVGSISVSGGNRLRGGLVSGGASRGTVLGYEPRTGLGNPLSFWLYWPEESKAKMTCIRCQHDACKRFGTYGRRKIQRWCCRECKATFSTSQPKIGTHYTDLDTVGKILTLMLEGMSIRAIERFTGVHRDTILRIMNTAGAKARQLLDSKLQNITPNFVQVDEMWTYIHTREPNLHKDDSPEWGSIYLWLALDSETKLIITNHLGSRNGINAHRFMFDLRSRTVGKYQITSDAFQPYLGAVREWFGSETNYGVLRKIYGKVSVDNRYGSGQVLGAVAYDENGLFFPFFSGGHSVVFKTRLHPASPPEKGIFEPKSLPKSVSGGFDGHLGRWAHLDPLLI